MFKAFEENNNICKELETHKHKHAKYEMRVHNHHLLGVSARECIKYK